jgi:glycosyltransferase involved in cell wall biosynthesis
MLRPDAGMRYRVAFYCPDRHLVYDGRTPDEVGVGGGVTARVRMGRALARLGHEVTQVVNCPRRETIDGVEYMPLDEATRLQADVIVFNTSGGELDLSPAAELKPSARLSIVWVHGTQEPNGLERLPHDALYAVSNFVGHIACTDWGVPASRLFVTYNGHEEGDFAAAEAAAPDRDPHQLIYFSHPSKGLETAQEVLAILRRADRRFHLEVAGGARLWGGIEEAAAAQEGVCDHGLLGQRRLVPLLFGSTYSLQLQDREEPFGLAVVESMRASALVIASPVGAFTELVNAGENGVLIPGDHRTPEARRDAAEKILWLQAHPQERQSLVSRARLAALNTDTLAAAWTLHWGVLLGAESAPHVVCAVCRGQALRLADGDHCRECGHFSPRRQGEARR